MAGPVSPLPSAIAPRADRGGSAVRARLERAQTLRRPGRGTCAAALPSLCSSPPPRTRKPFEAINFESMKKAVIYGSTLASFCVEKFGTERLESLKSEEICRRLIAFKELTQFEIETIL